MHHWYWVAGCGMLLAGGLYLYSALRAGDGTAPPEAARLRRHAIVALGCGAAIHGVALLYQVLGSVSRYEVSMAGSVAFTALTLVGVVLYRRAV